MTPFGDSDRRFECRPATERARPRTFEDFGDSIAAAWIRREMARNRGGIAVLLHGPPGVGKTSLATVAARESSTHAPRVVSCAAWNSDGVRDTFSGSVVGSSSRRGIVLDEIDSLGMAAQRTLESAMATGLCEGSAVFATCNSLEPLSDGLRARMVQIRMGEIDARRVRECVVASFSERPFDPDMVSRVVESCGGDVRRAVSEAHSRTSPGADVAMSASEAAARGRRDSLVSRAVGMIREGAGCRGEDVYGWASELAAAAVPVHEVLLGIVEAFPGRWRVSHAASEASAAIETGLDVRIHAAAMLSTCVSHGQSHPLVERSEGGPVV